MRDEHCHIIWDVDDGSRTLDESLLMLDAAKRVGITEIVATPHMRWSDFDEGKVRDHFLQLREEATKRGIKMALGFEVFYRTLLDKGLDQAQRFVRAGSKDLLIEFNTGGPMSQGWERTVYELQGTYGLDITIAHPERYSTVLDDFESVYRILDMDCRIQVSAGDLFDGFFSPVSRCAKRIIKEELCDALVSDAHRPEHYEQFGKALAKYF